MTMEEIALNIYYCGTNHFNSLKNIAAHRNKDWIINLVVQINDFKEINITEKWNILFVDWNNDNLQLHQLAHLSRLEHLVIIAIADTNTEPGANESFLFDYLLTPVSLFRLELTLRNAAMYFARLNEIRQLHLHSELKDQELQELNKIGIALSAQHHIDSLLEMILQKSREITGADAGSLYLVEKKDNAESASNPDFSSKQLRFKLSHNDTLNLSYNEFVMPIQKQSMAGYAVITGAPVNIEDVYQISPGSEFQHNRKFDENTGYRTKSVLSIPMKTHKGEIIGVLQLINRKRNFQVKLANEAIVAQEVLSFDQRCINMASSLASQAAVSIENTRLYDDIKRSFEGFIHASMHAIEQRDPTTSGHSERVALLSVRLAETVDRITRGKYKNIRFTHDDIQQIKYAALLHDFGKIGVRENVLVKAKKLYPEQLDLIKLRFKLIKAETKLKYSYQKIQNLLEKTRNESIRLSAAADQALAEELNNIDDWLDIIIKMNEPTVVPGRDFEKIEQIGKYTYAENGHDRHFLNPEELNLLTIAKGTLNQHERIEIESHVTHTFNFLMRIPWPSELKLIPFIAYTHHEKLDGSGYPRGLRADAIPIQAKIMTIADIYDALTAWDRPYKKAVPVEKALDILQSEVNEGKVDPDLVKIFLDAEIFKMVNRPQGVD